MPNPVVVEVLHWIVKDRKVFDLLQNSGSAKFTHLLGILNICTKFNANTIYLLLRYFT